MSSNKNFTKNINRIMSLAPGQTFHGTISETQYASGNTAFRFSVDLCKLMNVESLFSKSN